MLTVQRERPGQRALKPPAESWGLKLAPRDCTPRPLVPSAGPLEHTVWSQPWGPPSDARSHPVCSLNSTCSCPHSVPGHTPPPPAPAKAEAWSCLPPCSQPFPSPRLHPLEETDSTCTPRTQPSEGTVTPACHPHSRTPADKGCLYPLGSGQTQADPGQGWAGRKGRRKNPLASKLQFLWGCCQPQLFGAYCIPGMS